MARDRTEQCPERGAGLTHVVDGSWACEHCGVITYLPDDAMSKLRAQFIEGLFQYEDRVQADHSVLTEDQWHRAILVRSRYEQGRITED